MSERLRLPYQPMQSTGGSIVYRPLLPLTLKLASTTQTVTALVDSGADVNVLPYRAGVALGAVWEDQRIAMQLSGNLANVEARGLLLDATVGDFSTVRLAFAWTQSESVPLILGQTNFFSVFNIFFYGKQRLFEIELAI